MFICLLDIVFYELSFHDFCPFCICETLYVKCSLWTANISPNSCLLILGGIVGHMKVSNIFQKSVLLIIFLMLLPLMSYLEITFPSEKCKNFHTFVVLKFL